MKVVFLGTNGWYDSETGNTISVLVDTEAGPLVFDAGYGLARLDRYLPKGDPRPAFLFLSHFHLDHVAGLHTLAKLRFAGGLTISGPEGTRKILGTLVNEPFTLPLADLPYPVSVLELPRHLDRLPFKAQALPLRHASLTLGYRIEVTGKVIAYCSDTGYCANAVALARHADLLIAECAYAPGLSNEAWPHLNPEQAARIACEAQAKRLALVHFDARQYPSLSHRERAAKTARDLFPFTDATVDGMTLTLV